MIRSKFATQALTSASCHQRVFGFEAAKHPEGDARTPRSDAWAISRFAKVTVVVSCLGPMMLQMKPPEAGE
jgi:hypothetical protein